MSTTINPPPMRVEHRRPIPPGSSLPVESMTTLMPELELYPELDLKTLRYHAEQSDSTARNGHWHASINEARAMLECLLVNAALIARGESIAAFRQGKENQICYDLCQGYLIKMGFLDADEQFLLQHVRSIATAKGSSAGETDEAWGRLGRRLILAAGQYLLERYESWRVSYTHITVPEEVC